MARYCVDCREHPSDEKCSLALSADTKEELREAVVQHAIKVHGFQDTSEVRSQIMNLMKEGSCS
jgi:predicted small metal-binding protein